jgi:quercetin dioxygenase-like cupin family protein
MAALGALVAVAPLAAQQPAAPATIKRTLLQRVDIPNTSYEAVSGIAEVPPNVNIGRHTHFGIETGYVLEGEATLYVDGEPARELRAGDSYRIAAGAVHDVRNGAHQAKVFAVYVVEKGKPLATPAP